MRDLIVSVVAVALLIGSWLLFYDYSQERLTGFSHVIEHAVIPSVESGDWEESSRRMASLNRDWHQYRKTALLFLDTDAVNEIDYSLAKSIKYVKAEDDSNASGELNSMMEQLSFLKENDKVSWANIL